MSFILKKSDKAGKKYMVWNGKKKVYFGARGYEDYTTHKNPTRKKRYIARHRGKEDWWDTNTPGFWSRWILWNLPSLQASIEDTEHRFHIKNKNAI